MCEVGIKQRWEEIPQCLSCPFQSISTKSYNSNKTNILQIAATNLIFIFACYL